jgi:hypothetical protein
VLLRLVADDLYLPAPCILPLLGHLPRPGAVKRRQACYKLEGVHTPLRDALYIRSVCLGYIAKRQHFVTGRVSPRLPISARAVVNPTGNGRFPAGQLTGRDPQLFATSAILGGAEAHSHIAPQKLQAGRRRPGGHPNATEVVGGGNPR